MGAIKVLLPTLQEQKHIAALLSKAEALIAERKQSLVLLDEYLKATFLEMFGDPVRNGKGWEISKIGRECDVKGGKRIPKGQKLVKEITGFPYIKAGNIKGGKVTLDALEYLTPSLREKLKRYTVDEGDVCITVVGVNIGDIGIVPKQLHKANLTENANKILIKNGSRLNNIFLGYYLTQDFVQNLFQASIRSTGVPKLALFRIEDTDLLLPPLHLQERFATIYNQIEVMKGQCTPHLKELQAMYGSLCQRVFAEKP
jgi:type I restriction enzyme S subunit